MQKLMLLLLTLTLVGAGCIEPSPKDEYGCYTWDNLCRGEMVCIEQGGVPIAGPAGRYRDCRFR